MIKLIQILLLYIQIQQKIIVFLISSLLGKHITLKAHDKLIDKPYRKLQVDQMPIIEIPEKLNFNQLLIDYQNSHGKPLKPIKRHKNKKVKIPNNLVCPQCGAPHQYLYDNNGGRGQFKCKVCSCNFNFKNYYSKAAILKCPHCSKRLEKIKERKDYFIFKCKNDNCPFYLNNLASMSKEQKKRFKIAPHEFKVRYIYRQFNFDYKPLSKSSPAIPDVDISKIHASPHTLGLILTYYVNYGLSSRNTASLMEDIHGIKISHQTVLNYAESVACLIKPFVDHYPYQLSNSFCGDETYIKVDAKWQYIFFFFDAVKKIILSYRVSPNKDTLSAIKAIDDVLSKLKTIPDNLSFVVDGNPIYFLAQQYFAQYGIYFDINQVIGLTNEDPISAEYRPLKQIIERLHRTFKANYRSTHGFKSLDGSVTFAVLFTAYFNFLRPHSALENSVPVVIPELNDLPHMPARWSKLIQMAKEFILQYQAA
ncbi:transposase [Anoxybacter fermentans]|uniref:Transposase n=1 Tax=Anoxybacter fermentans TaxID=1323375 RepID=A0A3Q9HS46_9FIRM|nr:DDE-type integrase/transposase/recombinase [Anoxybacter fermentans]AZR74311.1 transposase [Anoxybacter fermentans]